MTNRYEFYIFARVLDRIEKETRYYGVTIEYSDNGSRVTALREKSLEGIGIAALNKHDLKNARVVSGLPNNSNPNKLEIDIQRLIGVPVDRLRALTREELERAGIEKIVGN